MASSERSGQRATTGTSEDSGTELEGEEDEDTSATATATATRRMWTWTRRGAEAHKLRRGGREEKRARLPRLMIVWILVARSISCNTCNDDNNNNDCNNDGQPRAPCARRSGSPESSFLFASIGQKGDLTLYVIPSFNYPDITRCKIERATKELRPVEIFYVEM